MTPFLRTNRDEAEGRAVALRPAPAGALAQQPVEQDHRRIELRASVTACRVDGREIIGQARHVRAIRRVWSRFSRGPRPRTHKAKTRLERRVCISGRSREEIDLAISIFPELADFRKPNSCHGRSAFRAPCFQAGCAATPEALLLSFIPVTLDLYRNVRRHLHWTLQNLVAFADRTGRCFPSVRTLAAATGQPRSTVSRHLAQLAADGVIARQRRPGGVYRYTINNRFLPAQRGVSHRREKGVPPAGTEEQEGKKAGYARARFARSRVSFGEIPDEQARWQARLRSWRQSRFWLPLWGPKPTEPGCFAPVEALQGI